MTAASLHQSGPFRFFVSVGVKRTLHTSNHIRKNGRTRVPRSADSRRSCALPKVRPNFKEVQSHHQCESLRAPFVCSTWKSSVLWLCKSRNSNMQPLRTYLWISTHLLYYCYSYAHTNTLHHHNHAPGGCSECPLSLKCV